MKKIEKKISVIGAGAWGTAIAQAIASSGKQVKIWARESEVVEGINSDHENKMFLPDVPLHENITAVSSIIEAVEADVIMMVTPAQALRIVCADLKKQGVDFTGKALVICSKGFEIGSGKLLSQVIEEEIPEANVAIMTGPTFASDVARGLPSAVTLAAKNIDIANEIRDLIGTKNLRPYSSDDIIGAQIGSALKNVIAIAAGITMGYGFGESARAALITRGIAEMARLTKAMGGKEETLMEMCGLGDLLLTCTSMQSRNYSFGFMLGEGKTIDEILGDRQSVTEGFHTAKALMTLAKDQNTEMPIAKTIYQCLHEGVPIGDAIESMLSRPFS